ncbi:MAG TPA: hypothetical protein VKA44_06430 [Gemmatimonadota bacterium]|nr:hypothetical protein [Gemmatimonadota bacterium]
MIEANMHPSEDGPDAEPELRRPQVTHRWIRTALQAGREAFEREMRRDRKSLDAEFDRFWKEQATR